MFLHAATWGYSLAIGVRNAAYRRGWLRVRTLPVPVISIGNLTTGGTGKTPVVAWIVNELVARGQQPAIVSRGYRSLGPEGNDEKKMLARLCPGVPHPQHPRRYQAALPLLRDGRADCIVLDDGFQHQQLARDLNILLIDATRPWGGDHLLPLGRLREPVAGMSRADLILLTRCDLADESALAGIQQRIRSFTAVTVLRTRFVGQTFSNAVGLRVNATQMQQRRPLAFCGIGNPGGFQTGLRQLGLDLPAARFVAFPDHHHFSRDDFQHVTELARQQECETLLCTHKDLVKVPESAFENLPVWALDQSLDFIDAPDPLWAALRTLFPGQLTATS